MDYVKIPQNVRVEDKLIGPLSLKQIILIALGGGFSYSLYAMINKTYGSVPITAHAVIWLPAAAAAAFAVVRINDISLFRYCLLIIEMMSKPRRRVWQPRQGLIVNIQTRPPKKGTRLRQGFGRQEGEKGKGKGKEGQEERGTKRSDIRIEDLSVILDRDERGEERREQILLDPLEHNVDSLRQPTSLLPNS